MDVTSSENLSKKQPSKDDAQITRLENFMNMNRQLGGGSDSSFSDSTTPRDLLLRAQISFNFNSSSSDKPSLMNTSSSLEEEMAQNQVK